MQGLLFSYSSEESEEQALIGALKKALERRKKSALSMLFVHRVHKTDKGWNADVHMVTQPREIDKSFQEELEDLEHKHHIAEMEAHYNEEILTRAHEHIAELETDFFEDDEYIIIFLDDAYERHIQELNAQIAYNKLHVISSKFVNAAEEYNPAYNMNEAAHSNSHDIEKSPELQADQPPRRHLLLDEEPEPKPEE